MGREYTNTGIQINKSGGTTITDSLGLTDDNFSVDSTVPSSTC